VITMADRTVNWLHDALRDDIADLVTRRPLPGPTLDDLDPFLFLNHHGPQVYPAPNRGLPFGPHPHRGFETVTFILEGDLSHSDSGGHESVIGAGGVQWMTAGRGLVHAELSSEAFKRDGGGLEILQLWLNLPSRLKMVPPKYVGLQRDAIPAFEADDGRATFHLVSGDWGGQRGPFASLTDTHLMTAELAAGAKIRLPAPADHAVLLYVVRGAVTVHDRAVKAYQLVELNADGDEVAIEAQAPSVLLFGHAKPFGEPIVAHGPFVMNTPEEIMQAIQDYQAGKFGGL
jgi:redox-sensitive bicupin YhaK (pirin superfamily)